MIIMKFGGTSVASSQNIKNIIEIAKRERERSPVIVVSALSGVTDMLLSLLNGRNQTETFEKIKELHCKLTKNILGSDSHEEFILYVDRCLEEIKKTLLLQLDLNRKRDIIVAFGEIISSYLISITLNASGIDAKQIIATDLIITNDNFGSADFLPKPTQTKVRKVLMPILNNHILPVITGFIGTTSNGSTTTLGRGGSDYTASIIGFCLGAEEVQIWTDVDGVFTSDPRYYKKSYPLREISYREAAELAVFGAKILHPRTISPAQKAGIPVRVLNTMNPNNQGTLIELMPTLTSRIAAVTAKKHITLINIYSTDMLLQKGFLLKVFAIFAKYEISIDLVSVSEVSISVTLDNEDNLEMAINDLSKFTAVTATHEVSVVSIIGERIVGVPQIMKRIFAILDECKIEPKMISFGATDINISLVVDSTQTEKAVEHLHKNLLVLN